MSEIYNFFFRAFLTENQSLFVKQSFSVKVYGPAGGRHIPDRNGSFFNTGSMAQGEDKVRNTKVTIMFYLVIFKTIADILHARKLGVWQVFTCRGNSSLQWNNDRN